MILTIFQNDLIRRFHLHQLKIMEHKTTGWLWHSGLGLAIKYMFRVTSVYLVFFNFNNYLILSLAKVFLSLQVFPDVIRGCRFQRPHVPGPDVPRGIINCSCLSLVHTWLKRKVLTFLRWVLFHVCTHMLFLKILLAYCLRWVLANITSACILLRISITLSFSPGAYFSSRPLWRVDNACHLPQSTSLPANRQAGVTSASPALISIHTLAY